MRAVSFPLIPGQPDVQFRFTIKAAREMDTASTHGGIQLLLKNSLVTEAIVLMTCYGLKHMHPRMTEDKAADLIQQYVDTGGDSMELFQALFKALQESGVYGKPTGDEVRPPMVPETAETKTA